MTSRLMAALSDGCCCLHLPSSQVRMEGDWDLVQNRLRSAAHGSLLGGAHPGLGSLESKA